MYNRGHIHTVRTYKVAQGLFTGDHMFAALCAFLSNCEYHYSW